MADGKEKIHQSLQMYKQRLYNTDNQTKHVIQIRCWDAAFVEMKILHIMA